MEGRVLASWPIMRRPLAWRMLRKPRGCCASKVDVLQTPRRARGAWRAEAQAGRVPVGAADAGDGARPAGVFEHELRQVPHHSVHCHPAVARLCMRENRCSVHTLQPSVGTRSRQRLSQDASTASREYGHRHHDGLGRVETDPAGSDQVHPRPSSASTVPTW
eukprot:1219946-Rhodomonas_salina.2